MRKNKKKALLNTYFSYIKKRFPAIIKKNDTGFLLVIAILSGIGMCWVCSTTQIIQPPDSGTMLSFSLSKLANQFIALILGLLALVFMSTLDLERTLKKFHIALGIYIAACILLLLTLFAPPAQGVRRWIPLGPFNMQTAEFAKISIILLIAAYMNNRRHMADMQQNSFKLLYPFALAAIGLFLIAAEPDIGIPALTFFAICCMMYSAGVSIRDLLRVCIYALPLLIIDCLRNMGHRLGRIESFILSLFTDQKVDILGDAYQISNSLIGICSGGLFGRGFSHSHQKVHLLTQHESDFVFSVYAEETGLIGTLSLLLLFSLLMYYCYRIIIYSKDVYCRSLALGLSIMLGVQAFYSIAVNANLAPIKGITLPFISYGGSSLISTFLIIGLMMNISAHRSRLR